MWLVWFQLYLSPLVLLVLFPKVLICRSCVIKMQCLLQCPVFQEVSVPKCSDLSTSRENRPRLFPDVRPFNSMYFCTPICESRWMSPAILSSKLWTHEEKVEWHLLWTTQWRYWVHDYRPGFIQSATRSLECGPGSGPGSRLAASLEPRCLGLGHMGRGHMGRGRMDEGHMDRGHTGWWEARMAVAWESACLEVVAEQNDKLKSMRLHR